MNKTASTRQKQSNKSRPKNTTIILERDQAPDLQFKIDKLLLKARQYIYDNQWIRKIRCRYIFFIVVTAKLTDKEDKLLKELLNAEEPSSFNGYSSVVIARPEVTTPSSTKATYIAHNIGLKKVHRIELGKEFFITMDPIQYSDETPDKIIELVSEKLCDRMTETIKNKEELSRILSPESHKEASKIISIIEEGPESLNKISQQNGFALSETEIDYFANFFSEIVKRNPTEDELMMFAQLNSEHCRHKIFNAKWIIDGKLQPQSLLQKIKQTYQSDTKNILSAYHDNAAVVAGYNSTRFFANPDTHQYQTHDEQLAIVMKVETHNHPTAISPKPGAATGAGGEIRDESATGRGAKPKASLVGFTVSNLNIPDFRQAWEEEQGINGKPYHITSALTIMIEGPIGAATYNNEFGRPLLTGYFRTYERREYSNKNETLIYGYHKPIMLAGGYGLIRENHINKHTLEPGLALIVLGGPGMLIGLGGSTASSRQTDSRTAKLDFLSVQRDNADMARLCQQVIDSCWAYGESNPIKSIHDVGAGGLANAIPEILRGGGCGGELELREIPVDLINTPFVIWCNEAQERYVLAVATGKPLELFKRICQRERAPYAVIGKTIGTLELILNDSEFKDKQQPINLPLSFLFDDIPSLKITCDTNVTQPVKSAHFALDSLSLDEVINRVLRLPSVASKHFLITIADRSITGLVVRDQMVGPWQVPVADCAVTCDGYDGYTGEAMALGERSPVAQISPAASARLAIAEAIMNIAAARILKLSEVVLSANWMAAPSEPGQALALYQGVEAASTLCQQLGITIPVGKDSLSMSTIWTDDGRTKKVISPLSLNITAFARVADVRLSLTPGLQRESDTQLLAIDLAAGKQRIGGTALCQVYNQLGNEPPDLDDPQQLIGFFQALQLLNESGLILAHHDRSDGGLFVTLVEMAFAGHTGLTITIAENLNNAAIIQHLFNEELGAVIQIKATDKAEVCRIFEQSGLPKTAIQEIATLNDDYCLKLQQGNKTLFSRDIDKLHQHWSETSYHMQRLRDNPDCAKQEQDSRGKRDDRGLFMETSLESINFSVNTNAKPKMAVLHEQGVNGQVEMAAAFDRAGFDCIDVHMQDLIAGDQKLSNFQGLVACSGFSYGDVLGAGSGWAKTILYNNKLRAMFGNFFNDTNKLVLGICNGCQMLSQLHELIPGTDAWPRQFAFNQSEQFEARLVMVEVMNAQSILLRHLAGSKLPIVVAHGEGRVESKDADAFERNAVMRYIDNNGQVTENYPANPNGSIKGLTGFTNDDGRITIMMPHPERVFLTRQFSWFPGEWRDEYSPWMQLFINARTWLDGKIK